MKKQLPVCAVGPCRRKVATMRSKLCHFHFMEQAVRRGQNSIGNAKGNPGGVGNAEGNPGNAGRAGGNPGNAGNTSTGQVKIKAGKRSGLRRRAKFTSKIKTIMGNRIECALMLSDRMGSSCRAMKNMHTMKAMAVPMTKTTKTMQATKTARRANSYAEGVAKLPRTMTKAMKAMKTMKRVQARARRELDD